MSLLGWTGQEWALGITAVFLLGGALFAVSCKRTFHSVMGLGVSLVAVAGVFVIMGQALLGVIQVLVYVGGILTLFVFAVMFVAGDEEEDDPEVGA